MISAVEAYRRTRGFPDDWQPDWSSAEWNWFKIGWDAYYIAEQWAVLNSSSVAEPVKPVEP